MKNVIVYNSEEIVLSEQISDTAIVYYAPEYNCIMTNSATEVKFESVEDKKIEDIEKVKVFLSEMGAVISGSETEAELSVILDNYLAENNYPPEWDAGIPLAKDQVLEYLGKWYKVIQAHTSQQFWTPLMVPALFVEVPQPGDIPVWVQPTGAHDAYAIGAKVHFPTINDSIYESLINANVWSPTAYPAGWRIV